MALNTTELRQKRQTIIVAMRELNDGMIERGQETDEEKEKYEKMETDCRSLERVIEREEGLAKLEADAAKTADARSKGTGHDRFDGIRYGWSNGVSRPPSKEELERGAAFFVQGWLLNQKPSNQEKITDEHREAAKFFGSDLGAKEIVLPLSKD